MLDHGDCFKLFKTVGALQCVCRILQNASTYLAGYHILPQGLSNNHEHKSVQCDWSLSSLQNIISNIFKSVHIISINLYTDSVVVVSKILNIAVLNLRYT